MLQILGLRENLKGDIYTQFHENNWFAENIQEILKNPDSLLDFLGVPGEERLNLYFTVADGTGLDSRDFELQRYLAFDIDKVPDEHLEGVFLQACIAIKADPNKTGLVATGNGLQMFIELEDPLNKKELLKYKPVYSILCTEITAKLDNMNLPGRVDLSIWDDKRLVRMPGTINKKPSGEKSARVLRAEVEKQGFNLKKIIETPDIDIKHTVDADSVEKYGALDSDNIQKECNFLSFTRTDQTQVSEQQWYAMLSLVGRLPGGKNLVHEYSREDTKRYDAHKVDMKFYQALEKSGPRTCININSMFEGCKTCKWWTKISTPLSIQGEDFIRTAATGFHFVTVDDNGNTKRKIDSDGVIKFFKKNTIYSSNHSTFYRYGGARWETLRKADLETELHYIMNPRLDTNKAVSDLMGSIKRGANVLDGQTSFIKGYVPGFINLNNGVFSLKERKLLDHSKGFGFLWVLPFNFDPSAKAPRFERFLEEVTEGDQNKIGALMTFLAVTLAGVENKTFQRALMLVGEGANGKSLFLDIVRALIGKQNTTAIPLGEMTKEGKIFDMVGKLANIAEETSFINSLRSTDVFKTITGGGSVQARAHYVQSFETVINAKIMTACNELPQNFDHSGGMYRRLCIVEFTKVFSHSERDTNLYEKLIVELPGIFNLALKYLDDYQKEGWIYESYFKERTNDYQYSNNPVLQFFSEKLEIIPGHHEQATDIYEAFKIFHKEAFNKETSINRSRLYDKIAVCGRHQGVKPKLKSARTIEGVKIVKNKPGGNF